jgi:hypothetical protein
MKIRFDFIIFLVFVFITTLLNEAYTASTSSVQSKTSINQNESETRGSLLKSALKQNFNQLSSN